MFSHGIQAYSQTSAAAAVSAAVAEASAGFGKDAKSVHIIVNSVFQIGDGWEAIVSVIVEPDLDDEVEQELKEAELKKEHDRKLDDKPKEDLGGGEASHVLDLPEPPEMDDLIAHVHFPTEYEPAYQEFINQDKPSDDLKIYSHLIPEGSLWEAVQKHPLDMEFYEADHTAELKQHREADSPKPQPKMTKPEVKPRKRTLIDELEFDA